MMKIAIILSCLAVAASTFQPEATQGGGGRWDYGNDNWGNYGDDDQRQIGRRQVGKDSSSFDQKDCSAAVANRNKAVALGFINEVLGDHNIKAVKKFVAAEQYIQHNPNVGDGLQAVEDAMATWYKDAPKEKMDVRSMICQCDLCMAHIKTTEEGKPVAQVDIFRFCPQYGGKICEHWDVIQAIPSKAANSHPMF